MAALVREVRASQEWIHQVKSLHIRSKGRWTRTPEGLAERREALRKEFPDTPLDPEHFSDLRSQNTETLEQAFDDTRAAESRTDTGSYDHNMAWTGKEYMIRSKSQPGERIGYLFDKELKDRFNNFLHSGGGWLNAGPHIFWWNSDECRREMAMAYPRPEDFVRVGREPFHGADCYVLMAPMPDSGNVCKWYVGASDHRLHGLAMLYIRPWTREKARPLMAEVARAYGASEANTKDLDTLDAWVETLAPETKQAVLRDYRVRTFPLCQPYTVFWMDDYREVAPDCALPMREGYALISVTDDGREYETSRRELEVVDVHVNGQLDPALFDIRATEEGATVLDLREDVPLSYKVKKDRTAEEWAQMRSEARRRAAEKAEHQSYQDSLIGKAAPGFPKDAQWLNGGALSWADLKGRIVVLDFWADSCGPCKNDFPLLAEMHKKAGQTGIAVVGIHIAGGNRDSISEVLKLYKMDYPIVVDTPQEGGRGYMFATYGVNMMPYTFVVDAEGRVAAHGQLGDVLATVHELAQACPPSERLERGGDLASQPATQPEAQTVLCVSSSGSFHPTSGDELLAELNRHLVAPVAGQDFAADFRGTSWVGWAIIPDAQRVEDKKRLAASTTLKLLQVEAFDPQTRAVFDTLRLKDATTQPGKGNDQ